MRGSLSFNNGAKMEKSVYRSWWNFFALKYFIDYVYICTKGQSTKICQRYWARTWKHGRVHKSMLLSRVPCVQKKCVRQQLAKCMTKWLLVLATATFFVAFDGLCDLAIGNSNHMWGIRIYYVLRQWVSHLECRDFSVAPVDMKWWKVLVLDNFSW